MWVLKGMLLNGTLWRSLQKDQPVEGIEMLCSCQARIVPLPLAVRSGDAGASRREMM